MTTGPLDDAELALIEAVVFTGGVGERAAAVRQGAANRLAHLGVAVDRARNGSAQPDADISAGGATVRTLIVRSREDLQMAAGVEQALRGRTPCRGGK